LGRRAADALLAVALAPACAACRAMLPAPLDGPVCGECWAATRPLPPPLCDGCGDPIPSWRTFSVYAGRCPRCRRGPRWVDKGRAAGEYDGALREIVHALKYGGRRSVAAPLGRRMHAAAADLLHGADYAVPVPLHRSRLRRRGFNQASDLARHLGLPVVDALRRVRATSTQTGLSASQRHRNVRGAFTVRRSSFRWLPALAGRVPRIADACIVLVDDVSTTGATLEACARVLKEAGAREVRAVTAARVVGPPRP
jgi:ComF family protein